MILTYFSICLGAQAAEKNLSLPEAVQFALENSPVFDSAKKTQSIRELEYKNAISKFLPSADITTTNGLQNTISAGNSANANTATSPWYSTLTMGITENLYDNGVSVTNLSVADLNRNLAWINLLKARDNLVLDIAAEFYRFSLATILVDVKKQQQVVLEKQLKNLTSQYQQGFKTKSDFLRLKTQVQRAEIDWIAANNSVTLSVAELNKLVGVKGEPLTFEPLVAHREKNLDNLLPQKSLELDNFYDFKSAKIQEKVNEKTVNLTERKYWPQVALSSALTYNNQNYLNSNNAFSYGHQLSWNALISLQYNFWDWGTRKRDIAVAQYNREVQENSVSQSLLDIKAKVIGIAADILRISRSYKLSLELLTLEEESNKNLESQYREGKVTYLDLITSLNNLLDAKVQFYTAYFDALQAHSKYRFYEGKIYETILEK